MKHSPLYIPTDGTQHVSRSGHCVRGVVIGLRSHRRGVCVSGHGTDVLAYSRTEDVERETDGM